MNKDNPVISVVLSFFNEEENIPELVRRLRAVLPPDRSELIFVNDVSTDRSLELLKELAVGHTDIKIVNTSRNFGASVCVIAGMRHAKGDVVIYMDADLQDPPELIPTLIETWRADLEVEVVYTTRRTRAGESSLKLLLTRLGYRILHTVSDIELVPNSGDFKLLSRRVVNELLKLNEQKPFVRGMITWVGFKQVQVFYDRDARHAGETHYPVLGWRVISNFLDSALISFSDVPLKIALLLGFIVSVGAFIWLIGVFVMRVFGYTVGGWAAIMTTMLVLGGVQLLTIGMLGLYINAIFRETRHRPTYIVKDTFGFD
ncbi:MAG: glycosyltransferase family 2 protein [Verrucomicrobiota bacterium]